MADSSVPIQQRKDALKYLVHIVGDVHQPLHFGNKKTVAGERSVFLNKEKVVSLQYLWDGGLIDWQGSLLKYATRLNGRVLESEIFSWNLSTVADWANESRSIALKSAYNVEKKSMRKAYIERSQAIIGLRLTRAGVRLAYLLNTILTIK